MDVTVSEVSEIMETPPVPGNSHLGVELEREDWGF